ncbi:hypothetical protein RCL1_006378 [Eukaryota sp. TZLM3-RCL]
MPKYVVIGGTAGGPAFLGALRRLSEDAEIVLVERSLHVSSALCGLPFALSKEVSVESLEVMTPSQLRDEFKVDLRLGTECIAVNHDDRTVTVKNLETSEVEVISFDKLCLSVGAKPIVPPVPNLADNPKVFTIRSMAQMPTLLETVQNSKKCVIIGGGFVGIECAEHLRIAGLEVTIIDRLDQLMAPFDKEFTFYIQSACKAKGVDVILNATCNSVINQNDGLVIKTEDKDVECDFVIVAAGVVPETSFLADSGIKLSARKYIETDEYMRVLIEKDGRIEPSNCVFAVGDAIEYRHLILPEKIPISLAGPTARSARVAAWNALNADQLKAFPPVLGTSVVRIFSTFVGQVGASAKMLKHYSMPFEFVYCTWANHVEWLTVPPAYPIHIAVRYEPISRRILGASVAGNGPDVARVLDVLSAFIQKESTMEDLEDFEVAYCPPTSNPKSVINFAGNVALNVVNGRDVGLTPVKVVESGVPIVDVRSPQLIKMMGGIQGAMNIPLPQIRRRLKDLPQGKFAVICKGGKQSHTAVCILRQLGCDAINVFGGFFAFSRVFPQRIVRS